MDQEHKIDQFISSVGGTRELAGQYLEMTNWDLQSAVTAFVMDKEEEEEEEEDEEEEQQDEEEARASRTIPPESSSRRPTSGRRLGDDSGQAPSSSSSAPSWKSRSQPQGQQKRFGSLADIQSRGGPPGPPGNDDDDSDKEQEFFTGGDKSGLAVQDPKAQRDPIQRLMETARRAAPRPPRADGEEETPQTPSAFTGPGNTLGGDDVESQFVPGQNSNGRTRPPAMAERTLHLWQDGFSVDDGPLYRYDDPANARTLDMINAGSAPLDIMNVESGQAVDVKLDERRGEKYVQPKQKSKPFTGGGQRLGNPTPEVTTNTTSSAPTNEAQGQPNVDIDDTQPSITLQIRLADGTRLPSRFNTTHTIGDVYTYVDRASTTSTGRPYTLATTFPTKEFTDRSQVLGDMSELKKGGVIVQKWS